MKTNTMIYFLILIVFSILSPLSVRAEAEQRAKHVVLIGFDGWNSRSVYKSDMPNLSSLKQQGCYTMTKRAVLPSSSAPNWASMFMGVPTEIHGYTQWGSKTPEIPSPMLNEHGIFPTVFSVVRKAHPDAEIGVLYEWDGIKHLIDTLALSYRKQSVVSAEHPDALCAIAEEYIKNKRPELVAICFDEPDHIGHAVGHDTSEYYATVSRLDSYIGRICKAISDAGIKDDTVVILTSDHGGIDKSHGGITLEEMETPFVIVGSGIKKDYEITNLVMQYDVASTIASVLGVVQPAIWTGRPVTEAFE